MQWILDLTAQILVPDFYASTEPVQHRPKNSCKHSPIVKKKLDQINYFPHREITDLFNNLKTVYL
jgi:hypothetical protein